ncbi:MAG: helix-turn-helix domain-containing protein [Candidatus Woesearchaeota archaeon]
MPVYFSQEIHPSKKIKIKFDFAPRALQYLRFFGLLKSDNSTIPNRTGQFILDFMGIEFPNYDKLNEYLRENKIIYNELEVNSYSDIIKEYTIVDCMRISELFEDQPTDIMKYKLYSINELCQLLSFSRPVVYKLIKDNKLKSIRVNDRIRVKHKDYINFINSEN